MGSNPPVSENALRVDDIGLDYIKEHPAETPDGNSPLDCCIEMGSSPNRPYQKRSTPHGVCFFFGGRYRTRTYDLPHVKRML